MTMAAPKIVLIVYGIPNPIRFRPKIRIDPAIAPITIARVKIPRRVPTRRALLPFAFSISPINALMLFV